MIKRFIIIILAILAGMMIGYALSIKVNELSSLERANYNTLPYKIELIEAQRDYYNKCETLLDSINELDEDTFHDVIMETDTYYFYEVAKEKVDSLTKLEQ